MRNLSVRFRILASVVIINLLGAVAVMVYLHESYSGGLDATTEKTGTQGIAAWEQIKGPDVELDPLAQPEEVARILEGMKAVTGVDYGMLLDKDVADEAAYTAAREALGEASAWEERDLYALLAATDEAAAEKMQFEVAASEVPENGKLVGVENGACSQACHDGVTGEGAYWAVRWSQDHVSRGHAVFPVYVGDEAVGVVYALEDISEQADGFKTSMIQTLMVVGLTLLVATLVIGMLMDILVLRRLKRMTTSIQEISMRVAGGDFSAVYEPDGTTDEIGSFETFFSDFINLVSRTLKQLSGQ